MYLCSAHPHRALLPREEALAGGLSLRSLEYKMGRVFRSLAFGYGKPQSMKVQTIEQRLSLTKKNGCRREVDRVDQAGFQILPHCGHAAADLDVFAPGGRLRKFQSLFDSARHKVKGGSPFHYDRFT